MRGLCRRFVGAILCLDLIALMCVSTTMAEPGSPGVRLCGWTLAPEARAQHWTRGNARGYFEGESVVFRADMPLNVGDVVVTRVSFDRALPSPGGAELAVQGFSLFENPFASASIPARAGTIDFPLDTTADGVNVRAPSSDGAFVCFGVWSRSLKKDLSVPRTFRRSESEPQV